MASFNSEEWGVESYEYQYEGSAGEGWGLGEDYWSTSKEGTDNDQFEAMVDKLFAVVEEKSANDELEQNELKEHNDEGRRAGRRGAGGARAGG